MIARPVRLTLFTGLYLLVFMLVMRVVFLFYFIDQNTPPQLPEILKALYLGAKFDLRLAMFTVGPFLLLPLIPWLNPFRFRLGKWLWWIWIVTLFIAIGFLYILDFGNYSFLGMRIDASFIRFAGNTDTSLEMVWESYPVIPIAIAITTATLLFCYLVRRTYTRIDSVQPDGTLPRYQRYSATALVVFLMVFGMYGKLSWYPLRWSEAFFSDNNFVSSLSLNPVLFFAQTFKNRSIEASPETARAAYPHMASWLRVDNPDSESLNYLRNEGQENPPLQGANVVFVILESYGFYKTGLSGNPLLPTPNFDRIASEGFLFDRHYTPHGGTARSVFTAVTGLPDIEMIETSSRNPLVIEQHTILDEFTDYEKMYFLGGSANWGQIRGLLTRNIQGLEIYEEGSYESPRIDAWGITDLDLLSEAVDIMARKKEPFLSIIQTSGNHSPYTLPDYTEGFERVDYDDSEVEPFGFESNASLNSFRFMDFAIGKFIEKARTKPYFENTLFVFFGDHGLIRSADHMFPGEEALLLTRGHVPLLLYAPGRLSPGVDSGVASEVDIMPTVASLVIPEYRNNTMGRNLFDPANEQDRTAFFIRHQYGPEIGIIRDQYLFKMRHKGAGKRLHRIFSDNPEENLLESETEIAREMEQFTRDYYETVKYLRYNNRTQSAQ